MAYRFTQASSQGYYGEYTSAPDRGTQTSVSFWFRWLGDTSAAQICSMYNGGSTNYWQIGLHMGLNYVAAAYGIYQVFGANTGAGKYVVAPNSAWFDGSWNHIASVRDGSTTSIYVNGVYQTPQTGSTSPPSTTYIGKGLNGLGCQNRCDTNSSNGWIDGEMGEVGQWDTALTAGDVLALYHGRPPSLVKPESLRSYVPLLDGVTDYGPLNMDAPNWTATASAPTDVDNHPSMTYYQQPYVVPATTASGASFMDGVMTEDEWWTRRRKQYWHRKQWGG